MAGEPTITIIGNLGDDPELRFTPSGAAVANFSVAVTPRTLNRQTNEWEDGEAAWYRCAAWRGYAENVAESFQKGQRVIVTGRLKPRMFEAQDGSQRLSLDLEVEECGPALRFGSTRFTRQTTGGGQNQGQERRGGSRPSQGQGRGSRPRQGQQRPRQNNDPWASQGGGGYDRDPWGTDSGDQPPF